MSDTLQFVDDSRQNGVSGPPVDKLKEALIKCLRRVSVAMNLARRFNAGGSGRRDYRRVATIEIRFQFRRRYATQLTLLNCPGLERPGLNSYRRYASKTLGQTLVCSSSS